MQKQLNVKYVRLFASIISVLLTIICANGKIYERCELARELRELHEIPDFQLATWVCIARHESIFNTSAQNPGSGDHGLFQISELFWCSPPGFACGVTCESLRNDDIEDDVICARRIFREHKRLSGDGFNAWAVYRQYCRNKEYAKTFLKGCLLDSPLRTVTEETQTKPLPTIDYFPQFAKKTTTPRSLETKTTPKRLSTTANPRKISKESNEDNSSTSTTTTISTTTQNLVTHSKEDTSGVSKMRGIDKKEKFTFSITRTGYKFSRL